MQHTDLYQDHHRGDERRTAGYLIDELTARVAGFGS